MYFGLYFKQRTWQTDSGIDMNLKIFMSQYLSVKLFCIFYYSPFIKGRDVTHRNRAFKYLLVSDQYDIRLK